jgi:hypothetical protein
VSDKLEVVAQRFDSLIPELEKALKHCQIAARCIFRLIVVADSRAT